MDESRQNRPSHDRGYRRDCYALPGASVSGISWEYPFLRSENMRFDNAHIWTFLIGAAVGYLVLPYVVSMVGGMFQKG